MARQEPSNNRSSDIAIQRLMWAQQALDKGKLGQARMHIAMARQEPLDDVAKALSFRIESDILRKENIINASIAALENAVELDSSQPSYWNNLSARRILLLKDPKVLQSERMDLLAKSEQESLKAISLNDYARPHQNLAIVYYNLGQLGEASRQATQAYDMANQQIRVGSIGELVCKGCITQGETISECKDCMQKALGIIRDIEFVSGDYAVEILDNITRSSRQWKRICHKYMDAIQRAASLQAQQLGITAAENEAMHIINLYSVRWKQRDWREYGDVAFHLIAKYPPDLAYIIIYSFRGAKSIYDPVPLILKAVEQIYYLRPRNLRLHLEMTEEVEKLLDCSEERAEKGAKIIAREISVSPLHHASGILHNEVESAIKPFINKQLSVFNPQGHELLMKASRIWLLTPTGLLKRLTRLTKPKR
jgi:tetratricopeptide (TPR) repeat protein